MEYRDLKIILPNIYVSTIWYHFQNILEICISLKIQVKTFQYNILFKSWILSFFKCYNNFGLKTI